MARRRRRPGSISRVTRMEPIVKIVPWNMNPAFISSCRGEQIGTVSKTAQSENPRSEMKLRAQSYGGFTQLRAVMTSMKM